MPNTVRAAEQERRAPLPNSDYQRVSLNYVGPRHPDMQAEVDRRVNLYAEQVAKCGCFKWEPRNMA